MSTILKVKNLRKEFGGVVAVDDNTFSVQQGERLGIIGPNGAGKTTTFNMIAGYYKPTAGTIEYEGKRISGLKPHRISRMGIGRTFQIVRAFGELSVFDHVLTGVLAHELHFRPTPEQIEKAEQILELTKLNPFRDTLVKNLTIASQRRIELATALATKPRLLLLDELMAGLTFVEIDETLEELRKINEEMGITLIVVEHVMKAIMQLCQRIIVLNYGRIIAEGTPQEVANNKTVIEAYLGEEEKYA
ncbi:MAG: ABC transporter ATP-binding protein [Deltaproteobacteria bacterium]|nr:ABC transporter ATP-binding protein [Deltaproteobacteria bacterium]